MDPVSLTLGIVPLLGGSLKVYKSTYSKLKTFRHYSREVDRVRKHFDRQRQFFLNEVHLVLRLVLDDECLVQDMIEDGTHEKWKSRSLDDDMVDRLGDNTRSLKEIIEDIQVIITDLQKGLECFNCLDEERLHDERLRDTVRRVRDRMVILFDKSRFEKWNGELRDSNNDLKLLREQMGELCKPMTRTRPFLHYPYSVQQLHKHTFNYYLNTRQASQALHKAFCTAWSTPDSAHFRHMVRLFLETKRPDEVQLDLTISCLENESKPEKGKNTPLTAFSIPSLVLANMITVHVKSTATMILGPSLFATCQDFDKTSRKRRRVVGFADEVDSQSINDLTLTESPSAMVLDLQNTQHFCSKLLPKDAQHHPGLVRKRCHEEKVHTATCIGYLDSSAHNKYRHSFFPCCEGVCNPSVCKRDIKSSGLTRMDEILARPRSEEISVPEQLQLALRLVSAVLRFNSTPWLGECWGLQDLYFFEQDSDLAASLKTLHISVDWSQRSAGELIGVHTAGDSESFEDAKLIHGIHNATVYNLGVALLAIGRWARIDSNDVLQVRRMASQACPLGPKYQEMTQKVLECDFGCGKDLSKPQLQQAIYDGIMLQLESMISSLSI